MRILLTGGSGFIGRNALAELHRLGLEVVTAGRGPPSAGSRGKHVTVDLLAPGAAEQLVQQTKPTHLLHLAWDVTPGQFWRSPDNLSWSAVTLKMMEALAAVGGQRAVFAGSCAEYAWRQAVLSEGDLTEPETFYGRIKDATRRSVQAAGEAFGVSVAWGRVFWLYGPHEAPGRLVSDVAASLIAGAPALCSEGLQRRDFLHVADVAGAFVQALQSDWRGPFNIGSGEAVSVRRIVMTLAEQMGRSDLVRLGARPSRAGEPPELRANVSILRDVIGFEPRYDLQKGLADVAAWWRARPA